MTKQITEQQYYDWVRSEPLSDPCVDAENVGSDRTAPDYWTRMLAAGKDAVAMREEALQQKRDEGIWEDNGCKWPQP
jgi:hypothetical protein